MITNKRITFERSDMKRSLIFGLATLGLLGTQVLAEQPKLPPVSVTTQSYQEVVKSVKDKNGKIKKVKKWVRASKVVPGTVVKYIDTVTNNTDKPLTNVAIKNPINPHLTYVAGSATSRTRATILYSVDGGKHFALPDKLYVKDIKTGKKRLASPKEYNAVEWVIASVPPESNTTVEFKAKLK
jgi:uncharacterized repeat protein (TIGR01451 family)